jgi:hypothetical protein
VGKLSFGLIFLSKMLCPAQSGRDSKPYKRSGVLEQAGLKVERLVLLTQPNWGKYFLSFDLIQSLII